MKKDTPTLGKVIEIDEARIKDHLGELVRGSVEDTLCGQAGQCRWRAIRAGSFRGIGYSGAQP